MVMNEYEQFRSFFGTGTDNGKGSAPSAEPWQHPSLLEASGYVFFALAFAGRTFGDGLYRVHDSVSGALALEWVQTAFPDLSRRVVPFGFDWLGTQLAIDLGRRVNGQPQIMMLEPGTGEALEIPASFVQFHEETIPHTPDAALARDFFSQWLSTQSTKLPLAFEECVGYRIPLFLGGVDTVENLERQDIEVYWTIAGGLISGVRGLPDGTPITQVRIED